MYEKKIPFDINCDMKITMEIISDKWKCCIINYLANGSKRPSELHRAFSGRHAESHQPAAEGTRISRNYFIILRSDTLRNHVVRKQGHPNFCTDALPRNPILPSGEEGG